MRRLVFIISLFFCAGCASWPARNDFPRLATRLGISQDEIRGIVTDVRAHHQLHLIRFYRLPDGGIAVDLADTPDRPHGITIVFRKVDGHWVEDAKSQGEWIV